METIRAAHNLAIEHSPTQWRLVNGAQHPDQPGTLIALIDARRDAIICAPAFAQARHLPRRGQLVPADVARVVVGWAPESQNWHLGLLLAAQPETGYKMRWCGLASWPKGPSAQYEAQAKQAGQSLADLIARPFHVVPPAREPVNNQSVTQTIQPTSRFGTGPAIPQPWAVPDPTIEPQKPPFEFEDWAMLPVPKGFCWQRRSRWLMSALIRVVGFSVTSVLFVVLGIGTQTRGLADVNPEWLPMVGIGVAGLLLALAAYNMWTFFVVSDVIVDVVRSEVRRQGRFVPVIRWRVPFSTVAYLVVSQSAPRPQGKSNPSEPVRITQDVWLHLFDGAQFREIAELGSVEGRSHTWNQTRPLQTKSGRRKLRLAQFDTPAHHAALLMARAIRTDLWLDVR